MSKIVIELDTDEETVTGTIDGKTIPGAISCVSVYTYCDYYSKKNKPCLSWNISAKDSESGDDINVCTNWSSASLKAGVDTQQVGVDITKYLADKKHRV